MRGYLYYGVTTKHKGLCSDVGIYVSDYSQKSSADQMRTTWEKPVHHVRTLHGNDISNKIFYNMILIIPKPEYTQDELD